MAGKPFQAPLTETVHGTDQLGRDVTAGVLHGARTTLMIGFVATVIAVLLGATIGGLAGYHGGRLDALLMRFTEISDDSVFCSRFCWWRCSRRQSAT